MLKVKGIIAMDSRVEEPKGGRGGGEEGRMEREEKGGERDEKERERGGVWPQLKNCYK